MRLTYSIKSVLRPDKIKEDGTVPIYYSLRVGPVTSRIPSGKSIPLKDWNKAEACPKKNTQFNQLLASYLSKKISDWQLYMLTEENLGKPVTLTMAKAYFDNGGKLTFFDFWNKQLELWQNSKRENTLKSYRSALKMLKAFNGKLSFGDLTYGLVQQLDVFMAKERNNAVGGRFVKHKCLKAMCNEAIKQGLMIKSPYTHFKIKASTATRDFLTIAEVKTLMNLSIAKDEPMQQKTLDLWLFSTFTGLRYSDVIGLKFGDINFDLCRITVVMTKTNKKITIPLNINALEIIEKYTKYSIKAAQTPVFPQIANQVLNRHLKDIAKLAGLNKHITFHVARHSFGSNLIEANTNILLIRDLMGHSRIAQTQIYTKALESDLVNSINNMQNIYGVNHAV